jgi:mono/diheme cytochrome c family protein
VFQVRWSWALVAVLAAACSGPDDHDHPDHTTGEQLYQLHCAGCHQGDGDGAFLKGVPPVRYTQMSYREMVDYIRGHGRSGDSRMPQFTTMSRNEAQTIAIYVRQKLELK